MVKGKKEPTLKRMHHQEKKKWETENCMLKSWYTKDIGIINRGEAWIIVNWKTFYAMPCFYSTICRKWKANDKQK